jgi:hypothetical protein
MLNLGYCHQQSFNGLNKLFTASFTFQPLREQLYDFQLSEQVDGWRTGAFVKGAVIKDRGSKPNRLSITG